jgi:hypothetical protein
MDERDVRNYAALDWKAAGYLTSMVSVLLLGAIAWPKRDDAPWILPVLIAGMVTSILGMGFRYMAHIKEKKELSKKADRR